MRAGVCSACRTYYERVVRAYLFEMHSALGRQNGQKMRDEGRMPSGIRFAKGDERTKVIGSRGAYALNALRTPAEAYEHSRKGGLTTAARRRARLAAQASE